MSNLFLNHFTFRKIQDAERKARLMSLEPAFQHVKIGVFLTCPYDNRLDEISVRPTISFSHIADFYYENGIFFSDAKAPKPNKPERGKQLAGEQFRDTIERAYSVNIKRLKDLLK